MHGMQEVVGSIPIGSIETHPSAETEGCVVFGVAVRPRAILAVSFGVRVVDQDSNRGRSDRQFLEELP